MVDRVLKLLLLLSPICYGTNIELNKFDKIFFHLGTLALVWASLFDKPVRTLEDIKKPLALLLGLVFANLCFFTFAPIIQVAVLDVIFASVILSIIVMYVRKPKSCFKYMAYAGIINVIVFGLQRIGYNPILNGHLYIGEEGGILGNAPRLGSYMALIFPFVNIWIKVVLFAVASIIKELTVVAIAYLMVFVLCFKKFKKQRLFVGIVFGFATALGIFVFRNSLSLSFPFRWLIWEQTLDLLFKRPFLGYGLGSFPVIAAQALEGPKPGLPVVCAFSSLLQFTFGIGLLGLVWLGYTIRHYRKKFDFSPQMWGIIALLMLCCIEYPIEIPRLWFTELTIIGFFIINKQKEVTHG